MEPYRIFIIQLSTYYFYYLYDQPVCIILLGFHLILSAFTLIIQYKFSDRYKKYAQKKSQQNYANFKPFKSKYQNILFLSCSFMHKSNLYKKWYFPILITFYYIMISLIYIISKFQLLETNILAKQYFLFLICDYNFALYPYATYKMRRHNRTIRLKIIILTIIMNQWLVYSLLPATFLYCQQWSIFVLIFLLPQHIYGIIGSCMPTYGMEFFGRIVALLCQSFKSIEIFWIIFKTLALRFFPNSEVYYGQLDENSPQLLDCALILIIYLVMLMSNILNLSNLISSQRDLWRLQQIFRLNEAYQSSYMLNRYSLYMQYLQYYTKRTNTLPFKTIQDCSLCVMYYFFNNQIYTRRYNEFSQQQNIKFIELSCGHCFHQSCFAILIDMVQSGKCLYKKNVLEECIMSLEQYTQPQQQQQQQQQP